MMSSACSTVTVLIGDPNEVTRLGLRAVLAADAQFSVVGDTDRDVLALALRLRPDLIVLDPAVDGRLDIGIIRELCERCPDSRLCIRTSVLDSRACDGAIAAGALGYLLKADHDAALLRDVLAAIGRHGVEVRGPAVAEACRRQLSDHVSATKPNLPALPLSEQERETLRLLATGHKHAAAACRMGVATTTVSSYVERIKEKLGVRTRAELVAIAVRHGLRDE